MRIALFCEHKYAINILMPLQEEAEKNVLNSILWFVDQQNIPDFPFTERVNYTNSIQKIYDFSPEVIFVPGNIVPYYLPGVKVEIFHGYAAEKKDHWIIRRYFDLYLTQGPFFTKGFNRLAKKYNDFEVVETGWSRQDWIFRNLHTFDAEKQALLTQHKKQKLVLYAPTFSPSLTSVPFLKEGLRLLAEQKDVLILLKFHPLTRHEWIEEYKTFAAGQPHILWIDDFDITRYQLMADLMISDTSSTIYEFLLLNKPVITYKAVAKDKFWLDINDIQALPEAFEQAQNDSIYLEKRKWIIDNYDPYLNGQVCANMLKAVENYISRHGVPEKRKVNPWRVYTSIKKFGKIKKEK